MSTVFLARIVWESKLFQITASRRVQIVWKSYEISNLELIFPSKPDKISETYYFGQISRFSKFAKSVRYKNVIFGTGTVFRWPKWGLRRHKLNFFVVLTIGFRCLTLVFAKMHIFCFLRQSWPKYRRRFADFTVLFGSPQA